MNSPSTPLGRHRNRAQQFPPEAELLLECAPPQVGEESAERIRELAVQVRDWSAIHRLGFLYSQLPSLAICLDRFAVDLVPPDTMEMFRNFLRNQREHSQLLAETMLDLQMRFTEKGIPVMPFVELFLGLGDASRRGRRPCRLVDFVIRREDVRAARELARSLASWRIPSSMAQDETELIQQGQLFSEKGPGECVLNLRWETSPWLQADRLDLQECWERTTPVDFDGRALATVSPEDALLHVCLWNSENLWVSLSGICDVAELVHAHPAMRWGEMLKRARESGTHRRLLLGLRITDELLGLSLPDQLQREMSAGPAVETIASQAIQGLFAPTFKADSTPRTTRFHLRVRENAADRRRYLRRFVFSPSAVDRKLMPLPPRLASLYSVLRPLRLAGSVLRRLAQRPLQRWTRHSGCISGFSPSGLGVVVRMLELAEVKPEDVVYDLGCGDGRIVIEAARRFGTRGVGIDIDPQRIRESQENARRAGVEDRVRFLTQDITRLDLAAATVVTLYLPVHACQQLTPLLLKGLRPGSRIVFQDFAPSRWDKAEVCNADGRPVLLYLHRVRQEE